MFFTELRDSIVASLVGLGCPLTWFTDFNYVVGETPLSDIWYPFAMITLFCFGIPALQAFMKDRQSPPLKWLLVVHNLFLFVMSGALAFFMIVTVLALAMTENKTQFGTIRAVFSLDVYDNKGTLAFLYYVNHLLKYYELWDTVFMALKKKPIGFLHAYHHPATLVLTWGQLVDSNGVQWFPIWMNLIVHFVMYFYYAMSVLRVKVPFKQSVTVMQITQFVLDLTWIWTCIALGTSTAITYANTRTGIHSTVIISSYLYLFVDFYNETYNSKPKTVKAK